MKIAGWVLFLVGVTVASWYAARAVQPEGTGEDGQVTAGDRLGAWGAAAGLEFGLGLALMIGGALVARRQEPGDAQADAKKEAAQQRAAKGKGDLAAYADMLSAMDDALGALPDGDPKEHRAALHDGLDALLEEKVPAFLEHRQVLISKLGLATFAELMSHFAGMERGAARAWSALTDEAWFEVPPCLERARAGIRAARDVIEAARGQTA